MKGNISFKDILNYIFGKLLLNLLKNLGSFTCSYFSRRWDFALSSTTRERQQSCCGQRCCRRDVEKSKSSKSESSDVASPVAAAGISAFRSRSPFPLLLMIGIGSLSGSCLGHLGALLILTLTFNAPLLVCVRAGGLPPAAYHQDQAEFHFFPPQTCQRSPPWVFS